jgi:hypothetical protein
MEVERICRAGKQRLVIEMMPIQHWLGVPAGVTFALIRSRRAIGAKRWWTIPDQGA